MCSTKALLGGDGDSLADIYRTRVIARGKGSEVWGWNTAYGKPETQRPAPPGEKKMNVRALMLPVVAAIALVIAGCGETPQVTVYQQGKYKGKPDNLPWQSQPFNGSQRDWEMVIDGRTKKQNEYARIENQ